MVLLALFHAFNVGDIDQSFAGLNVSLSRLQDILSVLARTSDTGDRLH